MEYSWQKIEDIVRSVASLHWGCLARAEHIDGVDFDAVLRPNEDLLVLIEISKNESLDKVRNDIAKIAPIRLKSFANGIMCSGYIVFENKPSLSMIETGATQKIKVLSLEEFIAQFFNFNNYKMLRIKYPFGSSFNPLSGEKDKTAFVPVNYIYKDREIGISEIANLLSMNKKIILVGDYGTGKSRCIEAVYNYIVDKQKKWSIAINLRDHWGAKNASEIIAGHLENLGISNKIDNVLQLLNNGAITILLDGVDEVGTQVFAVGNHGRESIRKAALLGVKKLVESCPAGVLLTTRAHYFDKDEEMIDALGLPSNENCIILRCKDEFTDSETKEYMKNIGISIDIPIWLPKKPLVFQIFALVADKLANLTEDECNNLTVWHYFLSAICEREASINKSITANAIREILIDLGGMSRRQHERNGRFTLKEIREAYEHVLSDTPDEAGEHMLMRLCTLGRVSPESTDRCFVDEYIADGLRAEALIKCIENKQFDHNIWKVALGKMGSNILHEYMLMDGREDLCITCLSISNLQNNQACAEILSSLSENPGKSIDCSKIVLVDCEFFKFNVGIRLITNLKICTSFFTELNIYPEPTDKSSSVFLEDCQVSLLTGVSTEKGVPSWLKKCDVYDFHSLTNISRIKKSNLPIQSKVLLSIIHRIFFQRGSARKEDALYKSGFEDSYNQHLISDILNLLKKEGIISFAKGKEGTLYVPERAYTQRMKLMMDQLMLSKDPIWEKVLNMKINK